MAEREDGFLKNSLLRFRVLKLEIRHGGFFEDDGVILPLRVCGKQRQGDKKGENEVFHGLMAPVAAS
jgi:hypothetical protein